MLKKKTKERVISDARRHETDTGSAEVQISLLTKRIEALASHLKKNQKDKHSRRGLLQLVANRRSHLKYLEKKDKKRYDEITKRLDLKR